MKTEASGSNPSPPPAASAWTRFWFTPIPTTGLHVLRVLSGLLFCFWQLSMVGHQEAFYSMNGLLDRQGFIEIVQQNLAPTPIEWSIFYLAGENSAVFQSLYWASIAVLVLFTLGVATRLTGILTWVVVVSFVENPAPSYEGDYLLAILAFYLMLAHVFEGQWNGRQTLLERILGPRENFVLGRWLWSTSGAPRPLSYSANLMMRLLQIHLAIILVTSGLHKLQMGDWWAGVALWYPLHPPLQTTVDSLKAEVPSMPTHLFFLSLCEYLVLGWQIGFPVFAWRSGWPRIILLGGAVLFWLGVVFLFKLPLFGPFVFLGCLSFLRPEEWSWLRQKVQATLGSSTVGPAAAGPRKVAIAAGKENIKK